MITKIEAKKLIDKISKNLIATRPRKKIVYRPFMMQNGVTQNNLKDVCVDLKRIYPDACNGDFAYVSIRVDVPYADTVTLCVNGAEEISINGKKIPYSGEAKINLYISKNDIIAFRCACSDNCFGVKFTLSTVFYPGMWACDYLYYIRYTIPYEEYADESGIAVSGLNSKKKYLPKKTTNIKEINFDTLYKNGVYAYAVSYALSDTHYSGSGEAFVNGIPYEKQIIKHGESIIVRIKKENGWNMIVGDDADFGIPFLSTNRRHNSNWLILKGADDGELPEIQFVKPYANGQFWRFADGSYLRPYLDTSFYGQWFYALMVGNYGILKASEFAGEELKRYFVDSMTILSDYYDYVQYDAKLFGTPTFLQRSIALDNLDSIGTIGMNLCDLFLITHSNNSKRIIRILYSAMENNILRFRDGTFHRKNEMWSDDLFMSIPFLARIGSLEPNGCEYFNECILQIKGFYKRLWIKEEKLFSHIFFLKDKKAGNVPWGRGNGWAFLSISELLERLPCDNKDRGWIIKLFSEFADGISKVQASSGMWHQVLDMPESYEETSCTGMFALGMIRGIKNGWLSKKYIEVIEKAISAVTNKCIDSDGNVTGVCRGSQCSYDPQYYANLGTVVNDDHGTGIILAMLAEYMGMENYKEDYYD